MKGRRVVRDIDIEFDTDLDVTREMSKQYLEDIKEYVKDEYNGYLIVGEIDFSKYAYENNIDISEYYYYKEDENILTILLSKEVFDGKEAADKAFDTLVEEYVDKHDELYGKLIVNYRRENIVIETIYFPVSYNSFYKLNNYCETEEEYKDELSIVRILATNKSTKIVVDDIEEDDVEKIIQLLKQNKKDIR